MFSVLPMIADRVANGVHHGEPQACNLLQICRRLTSPQRPSTRISTRLAGAAAAQQEEGTVALVQQVTAALPRKQSWANWPKLSATAQAAPGLADKLSESYPSVSAQKRCKKVGNRVISRFPPTNFPLSIWK